MQVSQEKWNKMRAEKEKKIALAVSVAEQDMEEMEKVIAREKEALQQILKRKDEYMTLLMEDMLQKEEFIKEQRDETREMQKYIKEKKEELEAGIGILGKDIVTGNATKGSVAIDEFKKAVKHYESKQYEKAIIQFEPLISNIEYRAEVLKYMSLSEWALGNKNEARKYAKEALNADPLNQELETWLKDIIE